MSIRDGSVRVVEISKFRSDHPDYAGMTDSEKRRAITVLLRQCNFLVNSVLINNSRAQEVRATVPVDQSGATPAIKTQMHASGIVWVRCNGNGNANGDMPRDGDPVIFDIETGNEVTTVPYYEGAMNVGAFNKDFNWNKDEYVIVGYAVRNANNDDGFYQVPIRLAKTYDFIPEGKFFATPVSSGTPLQSPSENVSAGYDIEPMQASGLPSWKEMRISHFGMNNASGSAGIGEDMLVFNHIVCDRGIVINPYPFGFFYSGSGAFSSSPGIYVHRSGGCFVVDRPIHSFSFPMAVMQWSTSTEVGSGHEVSSLTMNENPLLRDQGSGQLEWLPVGPWRYRIHGYVDYNWTGGTQAHSNMKPASVFVGPITTSSPSGYALETKSTGTYPYTQDVQVKDGGGTFRSVIDYTVSATSYATVAPLTIYNYPGASLTGLTTSGQLVIEPIW